MTTIKVIVEDEKADSLKRLLQDVPYVKSFEEEAHSISTIGVSEPAVEYKRIKEILQSAKGKNLFQDIEDPSEWQRQIRKEWDRDF